MGDENYQKILGKIARTSGLEKEEIERKIEAKRAKLSGLISLEGASQIIAAELGISFDNEKLKIDELLPTMRKVNLVGKIITLFPVRTFVRNDKESKVANFIIADETSNMKVVLWDTNHIELIEKGEVGLDSVVEIANAGMRNDELHLGGFSEFKVSSEVMGDVKTEKVVKEKSILDFKVGDNLRVRAFVVQSFEPRFFNVCGECKKKANQEGEGFFCADHGSVVPEKRALINVVIDDGSEAIRSVMFHDKLADLGLTELENPELLNQQRQNLLGKEMLFSGNVRMNKFFNNPEFIIESVDEINLDNLVSELEAK